MACRAVTDWDPAPASPTSALVSHSGGGPAFKNKLGWDPEVCGVKGKGASSGFTSALS